MTENIERQIIEVVAADRLYMPVKSMSGKLERMRPKLAKEISLEGFENDFSGERVYARVVTDDITSNARTIRQAIEQFSEQYPRYGKILNGMIEETRVEKETNFYFGMNPGCRLTAEDYLGVMRDLGFTEATSRGLYKELIDVSHKLARKRDEERSILIG